jgi:hypothetical protein
MSVLLRPRMRARAWILRARKFVRRMRGRARVPPGGPRRRGVGARGHYCDDTSSSKHARHAANDLYGKPPSARQVCSGPPGIGHHFTQQINIFIF